MTNGEKIYRALCALADNYEPRILFVPYRYDMWDSMQTIFEAAKRNRYILPAYYRYKCQDKWHSDWDRFAWRYGADVLTEYEALNSKGFDFVVFHYPYKNNRITEVKPLYQPGCLYHFSEKIVYAPYYADDATCDLESDGMVFADIVCATSENHAEIVKKHYGDFVDAGIKTVLSCGSPKFDLVTDELKGDYVLVAPSLMPVIRYGTKQIEKYVDIVTDLVVHGETVIFREHPLTMAGIKTMRPDVEDEWRTFKRFLMEHNVICEAPGEDIAAETFKYCKGAVLDPGSLVALWKRTGRPYTIIGE